METLIEAIRVAVLADATDEQKHQGALACRTIIATLETASTTNRPPAPETQVAAPPLAAEQITHAVAALRGLPPEQLLDLAIDRLRKALPAGVAAPSTAPVRFTLLPVGALGGTLAAKREEP